MDRIRGKVKKMGDFEIMWKGTINRQQKRRQSQAFGNKLEVLELRFKAKVTYSSRFSFSFHGDNLNSASDLNSFIAVYLIFIADYFMRPHPQTL